MVPPAKPRDPRPKPEPKNSGALSLPAIKEVFEADWAAEGFGPDSGLTIQRDVDPGAGGEGKRRQPLLEGHACPDQS